VDGIDLPHFNADFDESSNTMTCWVPSQPGRVFSFWWKQSRNVAPEGGIIGKIYLDDAERSAGGSFSAFGSETIRSEVWVGDGKRAPFVFT
jgi:hypothetical protein